jgi:predicted transcriptional regulator
MRGLLREYLELDESKALEKKIQKALGKYQFDTEALASYIGSVAPKVAKALSKMNSAGMISRTKKSGGVWQLGK